MKVFQYGVRERRNGSRGARWWAFVSTGALVSAAMLSACGSSGTGDLTIESGKAKDLMAKTSSVLGCSPNDAYQNNRSYAACDIPGGPDGTQLHFEVWSPDFESTQGLQELIDQCQDVTSAEVTQRGNFVIVGKNWDITMGGEISPKQVNGMRKLAKVNVYDCSG